MSAPTRTVANAALQQWVSSAFAATGMSEADSARSAALLVQTSLWGIDSHGVARVPHYLNRLTRGSIVARPKLVFQSTGPATGNVDGGDGLGFVVCDFAMSHAVACARASGVGIVGVRNSSHCGAIGLYTREAAAQGLIGIAFTHSDSFVVPHGGTKAFFGTNPISIAIPTPDPARPVCVDMATSVVPLNRIMNARRENRPVPPGLGVNAAGQEVTDPHEIVALKPMAEHKGFALAFLIDLLCGPLNGMAFGPHLNKMYEELDAPRRLGSLMIAFDPARFFGGAGLAFAAAAAVAEVKQQGAAVLFPGEPEYRSEAARRAAGIPVEPGLWHEFAAWSQRLALALPDSAPAA
jgi:ureidoglycolate dehydrogenase (NAD+)